MTHSIYIYFLVIYLLSFFSPQGLKVSLKAVSYQEFSSESAKPFIPDGNPYHLDDDNPNKYFMTGTQQSEETYRIETFSLKFENFVLFLKL